MVNKLKILLIKQGECLLLITALFLFFLSPYMLRIIDPTAGTYDVGVLQINITSIISLCIFQAVSWMVLKLLWPDLRNYFENEFGTDFKTLHPWQKITICLFVYCFIMLALVLLNQAIPAAPAVG